MYDKQKQRLEELFMICERLNMMYTPRNYPPYGQNGHYSHEIYRLMKWAIEKYPAVVGTNGVEGSIEYDANGGGVYTLGYIYINAGDPYVETITWRNSDPMHPNEGRFYVEGWSEAQEEMEKLSRGFWLGEDEEEQQEE